VKQLEDWLWSVTESKLYRFTDDSITLGELRTIMTVRVICEDCGAQYEAGNCDYRK